MGVPEDERVQQFKAAQRIRALRASADHLAHWRVILH
jgi:hypothetical protein